MLSTLKSFFDDIAQDVYSFIVAVAIFKLFYWWTRRQQATAKPLAKKLAPDFSSASEDTDRSSYRTRVPPGPRYRTTVDTHSKCYSDTNSNRPAGIRRPGRSYQSATSGSESSDARRIYQSLNPNAPTFRPEAELSGNSQKVQQSIQRFKEVIEDWEQKQKVLEDDALSHLQDAIAGLAPQDAAMVQALLDNKAAQADGMQHHGNRPFRSFNQRPDPERDRPWARDRAPERRGTRERKELSEGEVPGDSLRANLLELASIDSDRVIMVRKINQIGLDSANVLEAHYSKFGTIERIMVSHCMAKNSSGVKRLRPAALGFLVMTNADAAKAILAAGDIQNVGGVNITVGTFESHPV